MNIDIDKVITEATDLAIHACGQSARTLVKTLEVIPLLGTRMMALAMATGMLRAKLDGLVVLSVDTFPSFAKIADATYAEVKARNKPELEAIMAGAEVKFTATEYGASLRFDPAKMLGHIPSFLCPLDPRPAREQIDAAYQHGGGWRSNGAVKFESATRNLIFGDEVFRPLAEAKLRDETILYYDSSWTAIIQPDGAYDVARLD